MKFKTNIIFILCDDLGWRDLACYGSHFYETPHLDRLAAQGMRFTDAAIRLIEERDPSHPFFLNFWPYAVHTPIQAPADLVEKYTRKARVLGLDQQPAFVRGELLPILSRRDKYVERRVIQSDPTYAAMIENLDTNIGRLLAALDAAGIAEETLVVFTSDNGGLATAESSPTCNAPLAEGKGWMQDGGVREPLLVRWPGVVPAGSVSPALTTTPDFYPTFLEAAGLPFIPTQHVDGVSILSALRGEPFERGPIFWHFPHYGNQGGRPGSSIREGDWKLIEMFEDGALQLYNLRDDISESHNLAEIEIDVRDRLHTKLRDWRESVHALIPRQNPHWPNDPRRPNT